MLTKLIRKYSRFWQLYVFMIVPVSYIILFKYMPMVGVQIAFKRYNFNGGIWNSPWIGFDNFTKFVSNYMFSRVFVNTFRISIMELLISFPFPILFALLLNSVFHLRLKKAIQTITYMPHFISVVVLVGMVLQVFNSNVGFYGVIYRQLTGTRPPDIFASPNSFLALFIGSGIWQGFGWGSIIYMAALTHVNPELYEAAQIDGASRWKRIIHIEIPALIPVITILLILRCGSLLSVGFEKIYLMQNSLNLRTSEVISTYVYKTGLGSSGVPDYSYATAIGLFNSVINLVIISTVNFIADKISETSLW